MYKRKELKKISNTLDKEIINLINEQIWLENNASFYYLYLSTQFNLNGFSGISKFFLDQSNEEREHMLKLVEYLMDEDITPQIPNYNYLEDLDEKFDLLNHFEVILVHLQNFWKLSHFESFLIQLIFDQLFFEFFLLQHWLYLFHFQLKVLYRHLFLKQD